MFIENVGQWDDGARFQVRGGRGTMWLAEDAIWITVDGRRQRGQARTDRDTLARLDPERLPTLRPPKRRAQARTSSSPSSAPTRTRASSRSTGWTPSSATSSATTRTQWRPDVPVWGGVRYVDLYPGVDLELTSEGGQMVQRLAARPGADLSAVRLRVEGADAVAVDGDALRLSTAAGEVALPLLQAGRVAGGEVRQVQPRGAQAFDVAAPFAPAQLQSAIGQSHNPQSPADNPADLLYGTFLGGSGDDDGCGIAVDGAGSAYVTG